ncbi:hypothetical protein IFR05_011896 [Cadophora sp. M221]|nr:hypothetical protein IFR05_011896 [Cadophora sp. M221]
MAILINLKTEILCLSCNRRVSTIWKAYMVCIRLVGVWKFLRIGAGADSVKVTCCTVCTECLESTAMVSDDSSDEDTGEEISEAENQLNKIRHLAASKSLRDTMSDIKMANDIVIIDTFDVVERCLTKERPSIEVGKDVRFLCDGCPWVYTLDEIVLVRPYAA